MSCVPSRLRKPPGPGPFELPLSQFICLKTAQESTSGGETLAEPGQGPPKVGGQASSFTPVAENEAPSGD